MDEDPAVAGFYFEVGRRVRAARTGAGWTQGDLARRLGLTRSSVANVEAGRQRIPLHLVVVLAEFLAVPVEDLVPGLSAEPVSVFSVEFEDDVPESSREFVLACLASVGAGRAPVRG